MEYYHGNRADVDCKNEQKGGKDISLSEDKICCFWFLQVTCLSPMRFTKLLIFSKLQVSRIKP